MFRILLLLFLIVFPVSIHAETIFTVRGGESENDTRQKYPTRLLELALKKTIDEFGPYKIISAPTGANWKRSRADVINGKYENFIIRQSVTPDRLEKMEAVPFPVDLGIVGYRVAFTSSGSKEDLKQVRTLNDLKQFSIVQGLGWLDTKILTANDFNVKTGNTYKSMFKVVANNREDLFFRGTNELLSEWQQHKHISGLTYDAAIAIHYPLPRFFFTTKGNKEAANRIHKGLMKAYDDGSLMKLWLEEYGPSIEFVQLNKRRIFKIENPFLSKLDRSYLKYFIKP